MKMKNFAFLALVLSNTICFKVFHLFIRKLYSSSFAHLTIPLMIFEWWEKKVGWNNKDFAVENKSINAILLLLSTKNWIKHELSVFEININHCLWKKVSFWFSLIIWQPILVIWNFDNSYALWYDNERIIPFHISFSFIFSNRATRKFT